MFEVNDTKMSVVISYQSSKEMMLVSARYFQTKGMSEEAALLYQKVKKSKPYKIYTCLYFRIIKPNELAHDRNSLRRYFLYQLFLGIILKYTRYI